MKITFNWLRQYVEFNWSAQELAERGFAVTVYEYNFALGGKARSMDVTGLFYRRRGRSVAESVGVAVAFTASVDS